MMKRLRRAAVISDLARRMREHGSWGGATHIQKATFFVEELLGVPIGYEFVLYRHGPFSFDLRDDLAEMREEEILRLVPQSPPYGPKLLPGSRSEQLDARFPKTLRRYEPQLSFVAEQLGDKGVGELERLATALWVRSENPGKSHDEWVDELVRLKPHVERSMAGKAFEEVERMAADAPVVQPE